MVRTTPPPDWLHQWEEENGLRHPETRAASTLPDGCPQCTHRAHGTGTCQHVRNLSIVCGCPGSSP